MLDQVLVNKHVIASLVLQYTLVVMKSVQVQPYTLQQLVITKFQLDTLAMMMVLTAVGIIPQEHTMIQNVVLWKEL